MLYLYSNIYCIVHCIFSMVLQVCLSFEPGISTNNLRFRCIYIYIYIMKYVILQYCFEIMVSWVISATWIASRAKIKKPLCLFLSTLFWHSEHNNGTYYTYKKTFVRVHLYAKKKLNKDSLYNQFSTYQLIYHGTKILCSINKKV